MCFSLFFVQTILFLRDRYLQRASTNHTLNFSKVISSVTSTKTLPPPAAILLKNSLGFTQRTVWHTSVLAVKAPVPVLQFVYLPKLVAR